MTDNYVYLECRYCGFDAVLPEEGLPKFCPLCPADNGHEVLLDRRPARDDDRPEFYDARKPREG